MLHWTQSGWLNMFVLNKTKRLTDVEDWELDTETKKCLTKPRPQHMPNTRSAIEQEVK